MLSATIRKAINDQIRAEFEAGYQYLAMSAWFEQREHPGFARWTRLQWQEELAHGLKLFDFLHDRGVQVELGPLDAPRADFATPFEVMEQALERERQTTKLITRLYEVAGKEGDYATQAQLQWFLTEQIEEEKNVGHYVEQLRRAGDNSAALLMLDREMGQRAAGGNGH